MDIKKTNYDNLYQYDSNIAKIFKTCEKMLERVKTCDVTIEKTNFLVIFYFVVTYTLFLKS